MKKNVIALVWCAIVILPVFGIFSDGESLWPNVVSLIYLAFISRVWFPAPRWMKDAVDAMVSE